MRRGFSTQGTVARLRRALRRQKPAVRVRSATPDRYRVWVQGLHRDCDLQAAIEDALADSAEIRAIAANAQTGHVLLLFAQPAGAERAVELLERVLAEHARAPRPKIPAGRARSSARGRSRTEGKLARSLRHATARAHTPQAQRAARAWHTLEPSAVVAFWQSDEQGGLPESLAARRLAEHGENVLPQPETRGPLELFVGQLKSGPVALLAGSAVVSLLTGGAADAAIIGVVVLINASIGFATERQTERAIASLQDGGLPEAAVLRDGEVRSVPAEHVVTGDLLVLRPGVHVPADARILETEQLTVDESSLTGESVPAAKQAAAIETAELPLADRRNMVYRGTVVTGGSGRAVVVATGADTEIGIVQHLLGTVRPPETAMQIELQRLERHSVTMAALACAGVFGIGLLRRQPPLEILRTAVSLAVAAVPEGLPTVAITTLALGVRSMRKQNVLVRKLDAVETLGALQMLCLDKTGTITRNAMAVASVYADGERFAVDGAEVHFRDVRQSLRETQELRRLLEVVALCSDVELEQTDGDPILRGSPTEVALVQTAIDAGIDVGELRAHRPLQSRRDRSQERSLMATVHDRVARNRRFVAVKGRPEQVLELCSAKRVGSAVEPLTDDDRIAIQLENERMSARALRVLGVAYADIAPEAGAGDGDAEESDLTWLGLVGMSDPPRSYMRTLMGELRSAGVRPLMVTGDQSATAYAVGQQIGISHDGGLELLDSTRLEQLQAEVLQGLAPRIDVFSRVSPSHKLQIVRALQAAGYIVAMTGDGINDGPALKAANIGIAMGQGGTAVARDVADIVLQTDDLTALVDAIRQGRTLYDDVRKAVGFILATNTSEIALSMAMVAAGGTAMLTPMQLLWINLVSDIFPELALAVEPPAEDVMRRPPRDPARPMFTRRELGGGAAQGLLIAAGALAAGAYGAARHGQGTRAATLSFLSLVGGQLLHTISARSEHHSVFDTGRLPENLYMWFAVSGALGATLLTQLTPGLRRLLGSTSIGGADWGGVAAGAIAPFLVTEIRKLTHKDRLVLGTDTAQVASAQGG